MAKTPKSKKPKKSTLTRKLDKVWADIVKLKGECEHCGNRFGRLNAHHIFSRSNMSTRWNLSNGVCLCASCHVLSSKFSAHKTPTEFTLWLFTVRGNKFIPTLRKKALETKKYSISDLQDLLEAFQKKLKKLMENS